MFISLFVYLFVCLTACLDIQYYYGNLLIDMDIYILYNIVSMSLSLGEDQTVLSHLSDSHLFEALGGPCHTVAIRIPNIPKHYLKTPVKYPVSSTMSAQPSAHFSADAALLLPPTGTTGPTGPASLSGLGPVLPQGCFCQIIV